MPHTRALHHPILVRRTFVITPELEEISEERDSSPFLHHLTMFVLGVITIGSELLLGLRLFLKYFGANPEGAIPSMVYRFTDPLAAPFLRIFGVMRQAENIFEWSTLLLIIDILLVSMLIRMIMKRGESY